MVVWRIQLALLLAIASCRVGFGSAGRDAAADAPPADAAPLLTDCDPIAPVHTDPPGQALREPTLHIDGVTLLAADSSLKEATRASPRDPFGPFGAPTVIDASVADPAFIDGSTLVPALGLIRLGAVGGAGGTARNLVTCASASSCSDITLFDEQGAAITDDVDGPYPIIRDGELSMVFNRGDEVWAATPRAAGLLTWDARPLDLSAVGPVDDPAVTADGSLMIAASGGSLFALRYDPDTGEYVDPVLMLAAASPAIGVVTETELELFVAADTRGIGEIHRTVCRAPSM